MRRMAKGVLTRVLRALAYGLVGGLVLLVIVFVRHLESRPDLELWHEVELDAEFTADSDVSSFDEYLALEERLFEQLDERLVSRIPVGRGQLINRFSRGSLSHPARWPANWNRSFELRVQRPRAGVLLLHGMSDSPYSLRALAEDLNRAGAWVVGLRLPGHGTAPSGLVSVRWEDMAAALKLTVPHLRGAVGDEPLYLIGYSNGGALAVHYALSTLADGALPRVDGLVLVSPAIGVSAFAAFAVWQARLGRWLGLDKLAWSSINPEYDPFKYGSFAVNAGDQVHRLTARIRRTLQALGPSGRLESMPPILAFQSLVDATVSTRALVAGLFLLLPPGDHELVLFDINRRVEVEPLLREDPRATFEPLLAGRDLNFTLSVVTNENEASPRVLVRRKLPGAHEPTRTPLDLAWPRSLYSLSHIALPFPPDDPLYGGEAPASHPGIQIGSAAPRGERGVLRISGDELLRLRWNPFYAHLERLVLQFTGLAAAGNGIVEERRIEPPPGS